MRDMLQSETRNIKRPAFTIFALGFRPFFLSAAIFAVVLLAFRIAQEISSANDRLVTVDLLGGHLEQEGTEATEWQSLRWDSSNPGPLSV